MSFRPAGPADAPALTELERAASVAALAHVFPPAHFPYPTEGVLARWRETLADPDVTVSVLDGNAGLDCLVAHDVTLLRHLAVHPRHWGRGLARHAVDLAVAGIRAAGGSPRLWCLEANHRARGLYERLGWRATGQSQLAEWPPYPVEMEYALQESSSG